MKKVTLTEMRNGNRKTNGDRKKLGCTFIITLLSQQINNQTLTKKSTKKIFYWQDFKNTIKTRI